MGRRGRFVLRGLIRGTILLRLSSMRKSPRVGRCASSLKVEGEERCRTFIQAALASMLRGYARRPLNHSCTGAQRRVAPGRGLRAIQWPSARSAGRVGGQRSDHGHRPTRAVHRGARATRGHPPPSALLTWAAMRPEGSATWGPSDDVWFLPWGTVVKGWSDRPRVRPRAVGCSAERVRSRPPPSGGIQRTRRIRCAASPRGYAGGS